MEFYNEENNNNNEVIQEENNNYMVKAFGRMFIGLLITAIVAYFTYSTGTFLLLPYPILAIAEVAVVLVFSLAFRKLSPATVSVLYYIYAVLNGVTFSTIFAVYDMPSISNAFLISSLLFGALALYGYTTNKDMTKLGRIFMIGLVVGLIASLINLFIGNTMLDIAIDWVILLVFCGLTAYDIQKIKVLGFVDDEKREKLYVYFAMQLYLDFINIFIRILSLTAKRSRR